MNRKTLKTLEQTLKAFASYPQEEDVVSFEW